MAKDRWSLRNVYMYLVCLITLIMVIVGAVGLVNGLVELVYPDPYYIEVPADEELSEAEQARIEAQRKVREGSSRRQAILSLVTHGATLLIAGPLYIYHWRKIEIEHDDGSGAVVPATD